MLRWLLVSFLALADGVPLTFGDAGFPNSASVPGRPPSRFGGELAGNPWVPRWPVAEPPDQPAPAVAAAAATAGLAAAAAAGPVPVGAATCEGHEMSWAACEELPACDTCQPTHCTFSEWEEWVMDSECTGLCTRRRHIVAENNACGQPCAGPTVQTIHGDDCIPPSCARQPTNCQWEPWDAWGACDAGEQSYRIRRIAVQAAQGGRPCQGPWNETKTCSVGVQADCEFSAWGEYTGCSASCGGGYKTRMRSFVRSAANGGATCAGPMRQTVPCMTQACSWDERACVMAAWQDWSACVAGGLQRFRRRVILEAPEIHGHCNFPLSEIRGCAKSEPPLQPCKLTPWSAWTGCSSPCGGQSTRNREINPDQVRYCYSPARMGGENLQEVRACGMNDCEFPSSCVLTQWAEWSACSQPCGPGVATRARTLLHFSRDCMAALQLTKPCLEATCPTVDCEWGGWDAWSACSRRCGGGVKRRNRVVERSPRFGGAMCEAGDKNQVAECNTQSCEGCVDGLWDAWSAWEACSASCGPSYRARHRDIASRPNACGRPAVGLEDEYEFCPSAACDYGDQDCSLFDWTRWSDCSRGCRGTRERARSIRQEARGRGKLCPRDSLQQVELCNPASGEQAPKSCHDHAAPCQFAAWEEWHQCTVTCGGGQKMRYRHVLAPSHHGGDPCDGKLTELAPCGTVACATDECLNCAWGQWSGWGACSVGGGQRYRHRAIEQPPNACGRPCDGFTAKEIAPCVRPQPRITFCSWTEWETTTPCSAHCGRAAQGRTRRLQASARRPEGGALFETDRPALCEARQTDLTECPYVPCARHHFPTDCQFGEWNHWSVPSCSTQLCDRHRVIEVMNEGGGAPCNGALMSTKRCLRHCVQPQDCTLEEWNSWSSCSFPHEQRHRSRNVRQPAAADGEPCSGNLEETTSCDEIEQEEANRQCVWAPWEHWSPCSATANGYKTRARAIATQSSAGGAPCQGAVVVMVACLTTAVVLNGSPCVFSPWSQWSDCGAGVVSLRQRRVAQPPTAGGIACEGSMHEARACTQPVDCQVSDWAEWDPCDQSCGGGQRHRQRQVVRSPANGGGQCPEVLVETEGCSMQACHEVDAEVTEWSSWTSCTAHCGLGQRSRGRALARPRQPGGAAFAGALEQTEPCAGPEEDANCNACQDCVWGSWSVWGPCTLPCDGGQRERNRTIEQAPLPGCKTCEVLDSTETQPCNTHNCPADACVDGVWGNWDEWTKCSVSCGGGYTSRARNVAQEPNTCGYPAQGHSVQHASCNTNVHCVNSVACQFGSWGAFSACPDPCSGVRRRARTIQVEQEGEGTSCQGSLEEMWPCEGDASTHCDLLRPVDCQLAQWSAWGVCDRSCGTGQMTRTRNVLVQGSNGGKMCSADTIQVAPCATQGCPALCAAVDCVWGQWSGWGVCNENQGQQVRVRHILSLPKCGGKGCVAHDSEEIQKCFRVGSSSTFCTWAAWMPYSACSNTCGNGVKNRLRYLKLATGQPSIRVLEDGFIDDQALESKFESLRRKSQGAKARRVKELVMSWVGGALTLLVAVAVVQAVARVPKSCLVSPDGSYTNLPRQEGALEPQESPLGVSFE